MDRAARNVVRTLQRTGQVTWRDSRGKSTSIILDAKARALAGALASAAERRGNTGEVATSRGRLDDELFSTLETIWSGELSPEHDEGSEDDEIAASADSSTWLLRNVEALGFGGLNGAASTKPFVVEFGSSDTCVYGGNATGKTSLISAIVWAMTGHRLSDASGLSDNANAPHPIFDTDDPTRQIGSWPPIAAYPSVANFATVKPVVSVKLTFAKLASTEEATITRTWNADADGYTTVKWDERLSSLRNCLDVALEMPLRISHLRLGESSRLSDAVATLAGLDVIKDVGHLSTWLVRKNAPFLNTPKKNEHDAQETHAVSLLEKAAKSSLDLDERIKPYKLLTEWLGNIEKFGEDLKKIAEELTQTAGDDLAALKDYVAKSINLDTADGQRVAATAVAAAVNTYTSDHLNDSFAEKCPLLSKLAAIARDSGKITADIEATIAHAKDKLSNAVRLHRSKLLDKKLALKAAAIETHRRQHGDVPMTECILCGRAFDSDGLRALGSEIERLAADSRLLLESLETTCGEIATTLEGVVVTETQLKLEEFATLEPVNALRQELRNFLIRSHSFSVQLPIFGRLFDKHFSDKSLGSIKAVAAIPERLTASNEGLPSHDRLVLSRVEVAIDNASRAVAIANWATTEVGKLRSVYKHLFGEKAEAAPADTETIRGMCKTLSRAINDAKPAQSAAYEINEASKAGTAWLKGEKIRRLREEIASSIEQLGQLPRYVEAEIGTQIETLSTQIAATVHRFHLSAALEFKRARLERAPRQRTGFVKARATPKKLAGGVSGADSKVGYEIDPVLIANTSWMRALLWAFIFSLRQERAKPAGSLSLPLMLMDDPQTTFDLEHRCAWIDYMMSDLAADRISPKAQTILTTHDQAFVQQIHLQAPQCDVRHIVAPPSEEEPAFVDGTNAVDIFWARAEASKKNKDASHAIAQLRTYLEGMARSIFPPALGGTATSLGQLMDQLQGKVNGGDFPYGSAEFPALLRRWSEPSKKPYREALNDTHHTNEALYDYSFGKALFAWFSNALRGPFQKAFDYIRLLREAGWRTPHSGVSVVSRAADDIAIGLSMPLPANLNQVIGRVAAEAEGRQIAGQPGLRFVIEKQVLPDLGKLNALVLTAATLEPAAQIGDVLLLSPTLPPTENSLVVCHANGAWRCRRFGSLGSSAHHAVLVANSVNPREIRQPLLVEKTPSNLRKVVGIVYRDNWPVPLASEDEVVELTDTSALAKLLSGSIGTILVVGNSAEPVALEGQYLVSAPEVTTFRGLREHDGRPIVADLDGRIVFKRLRLPHRGGPIVLESLDAAGRHPPIVVYPEEGSALGEKLKFWPVIGVLFDTLHSRREC